MLYLAYGSNLHPQRLIERVGPVGLRGAVCLPGWRLSFDKRGSDGSAKANLRAAPGGEHQAFGAVFELDRSQYGQLDRFEGAGRGYDSFFLDVLLDGQVVEAVTYLSPAHWQSRSARPWGWYRDLVLAGARFHRFPRAAIDQLTTLSVLDDPDPARAALHRKLLKSIEPG